MAVASDGSRVLGVPEEGKEPAWKVKHTIHWRGPCVVCEKVSASTYRVKERSSGKVFERHVSLIFPAAVSSPVSPAKTPEAVSAPAPEPVADNEIVAIVDEPGDKSVWLMRCLSTDNDELQGHLYAPSSTKLASARFRLVHIERKTNLSILGPPNAHERTDPWVGTVPHTDEYVVARQLRFRANGSLSAASARLLRGYEANMLV